MKSSSILDRYTTRRLTKDVKNPYYRGGVKHDSRAVKVFPAGAQFELLKAPVEFSNDPTPVPTACYFHHSTLYVWDGVHVNNADLVKALAEASEEVQELSLEAIRVRTGWGISLLESLIKHKLITPELIALAIRLDEAEDEKREG